MPRAQQRFARWWTTASAGFRSSGSSSDFSMLVALILIQIVQLLLRGVFPPIISAQ